MASKQMNLASVYLTIDYNIQRCFSQETARRPAETTRGHVTGNSRELI